MTDQTGQCACGAAVTREIPEGRIGELIARTPFACDACIRQADEAEAADREAFHRDRQIRTVQRRLRESGIPAQHADLTLAAMDASREHVAVASTWVDRQPTSRRTDDFLINDDHDEIVQPRGSGLMLSGPVGVGKTHLAAATTGSLIRRGVITHWMSGPVLFARLSAGIGSDEHARVLRILTGPDALVLDDIDKTRPTAFGAENVFLAVDSRVSNLIPLLVTTNLGLDELANHWPEPFGEAIASRLAGYCRHVRMTGADRRIAA